MFHQPFTLFSQITPTNVKQSKSSLFLFFFSAYTRPTPGSDKTNMNRRSLMKTVRVLRQHLWMLAMALGFLLVAGQTAQASHGCPLDLEGQVVSVQHQDHLMGHDASPSHSTASPLCEKHCVPDVMQKESPQNNLVALPVVETLAVIEPQCLQHTDSHWSLTPPAAGPPATIRFCRFRE